MIERFDSFLIDRGFQPISDRLAGWASCYAIAAFLMTGAVLVEVATLVQLKLWVSIGFSAPYFAWNAWRAYRMEAEPPSNILPAERIRFQILRPMSIILSVPHVLLWIEAWFIAPTWDLGLSVSWPLLTVGLYFLACRRNPPKPRAVRLPLSTATQST